MSKKRRIFGEVPQGVSENLKAPETAPSDKRITGRTRQLNFKVREEFYWKLKNMAMEGKCMMVEVLEKALENYENQRSNKASNLQQTLKNIEKQTQPLQGQISWKELELRINNLNPTLFNKAGLPITYEVLKKTLQEFLRLGRK